MVPYRELMPLICNKCPNCGSRKIVIGNLTIEDNPYEQYTGECWVKCANCGQYYDP